MTVDAPGTNSPPRLKTQRAIDEKDRRVQEYMAEGMSKEDAIDRVMQEMRDNPTRDWRK